jgi:Flp pilus assembly protein TadG
MLRDESGSALVLVAVSLTAIFGMMGLAIDVGQLRMAKQRLQMAADAAALAGALELNACGSTANCAVLKTAAQDALTENGYSGSAIQGACVPTGTALAISINNGPCAVGASDPHYGNASFVEVVVSQAQPTFFAGVLGISTVQMMTRAEATRAGNSCIFALDPTGSGALTVDLLAQVASPNCGIVVESTSSSAVSCYLASLSALAIRVVGGYSQTGCTLSPTPSTGIVSPGDPLAYLAAPSVSSCGTSTASPYTGSKSALNLTLLSGPVVLYPGVYCGGIAMGLGANVTFMPGTFILTSWTGTAAALPGGLTVNLGATVTGTGVTFYN